MTTDESEPGRATDVDLAAARDAVAGPRNRLLRTVASLVLTAVGGFTFSALWEPNGIDDPNVIWVLVGISIVALVAAAIVVIGIRRWSNLVKVVTDRKPLSVAVRTVERQFWGRGVVGYRPTHHTLGGGTVGIEPRSDRSLPGVGDELEVWSLQESGRGPFLVLRVSDQTWWAGRGPDPVPSIPLDTQ